MILLILYFNTSHVNVNQLDLMDKEGGDEHFNTSHVNVNHDTDLYDRAREADFNTSHVNVNLACFSLCRMFRPISIHLMLMLISSEYIFISGTFDFNTSHVNVNQWAIR